MKLYQIFTLVALLSVVVLGGTFKDTTNFWKTQLNETTLHFESYAG